MFCPFQNEEVSVPKQPAASLTFLLFPSMATWVSQTLSFLWCVWGRGEGERGLREVSRWKNLWRTRVSHWMQIIYRGFYNTIVTVALGSFLNILFGLRALNSDRNALTGVLNYLFTRRLWGEANLCGFAPSASESHELTACEKRLTLLNM